MKKLLLSQGYETLIDDSDIFLISKFKWYARICKRKIYAARHRRKYEKRGPDIIYLHRFLMNPKVDMKIDHKNGNTLDNRKSNLRICTHAENIRNSKKHNGHSQYKGVVWNKQIKRWTAKIQDRHIGTFLREEEAARAYDNKAKETFGEYANLNFPNIEMNGLKGSLKEGVPIV